MSSGSFSNNITKNLSPYKSYVYIYECVWTGVGIKYPTRVDMLQNTTKQIQIQMIQ